MWVLCLSGTKISGNECWPILRHSVSGKCQHNHAPVSGIISCLSVWLWWTYLTNPTIHQISHDAPFCNRNVHTCAHFCYKVMHCGLWDWCIVGFVQQIYCKSIWAAGTWWHHVKEMTSTLLALCEGMQWSPVDSPYKGPVMRSLHISFVATLNKLLNKPSNCQWFETPWQSYGATLMSCIILCHLVDLSHWSHIRSVDIRKEFIYFYSNWSYYKQSCCHHSLRKDELMNT